MARQPEIQYIRYYTDGSAARQPEVQLVPKKKPAPKQNPIPVKKIQIDPLAMAGILVSCVLLLCMVAGFAEWSSLHQQRQQMQQYVQTLQQENTVLADAYIAGYELEEVEKMALALGMVPQQDVQHITVQMPSPEQVTQEENFWQHLTHFLAGLFA